MQWPFEPMSCPSPFSPWALKLVPCAVCESRHLFVPCQVCVFASAPPLLQCTHSSADFQVHVLAKHAKALRTNVMPRSLQSVGPQAGALCPVPNPSFLCARPSLCVCITATTAAVCTPASLAGALHIRLGHATRLSIVPSMSEASRLGYFLVNLSSDIISPASVSSVLKVVIQIHIP